MKYEDTLRRKSQILVITLFFCVILRAVVNGIFVSVSQIIPFVIAGVVICGILYFIVNKINPVVMMYLFVAILSGFSIALMLAFPGTANYLMFFLDLFLIVIYEDFRPILIQSIISAVCMILFYFQYQEKLASSWKIDSMAICIVYIASGCMIFVSMSRLNRESFNSITKSSRDSQVQSKRATSLLDEIKDSLTVLDTTSQNISQSVESASSASIEIAATSQNVADDAKNVADQTSRIESQIRESSERITKMADATASLKSVSAENATNVHNGNQMITNLSEKMSSLSDTMTGVSQAVEELNEQVTNISGILQNVRDISSQTNLLSLNASIEAARAGEAGRGFAVVAEQIRNLSDSSADFSDQIGDIITEVSKQMQVVVDQLNSSVNDVCDSRDYADTVASSFEVIKSNTDKVLDSSAEIEQGASEMKDIFDTTLSDVSSIAESMNTTSEAMEGISAGISDLNEGIEAVKTGYKDIMNITGQLTSAVKDNS